MRGPEGSRPRIVLERRWTGAALTRRLGLKRDNAEVAVARNGLRARADRVDLESAEAFQVPCLGELHHVRELVAKPLVRLRAEIRRLRQLAFARRRLDRGAFTERSRRSWLLFRSSLLGFFARRRLSGTLSSRFLFGLGLHQILR